MDERLISYSEGGDTFDAFVVEPDGPEPKPAVLVCHAWGGRRAFDEDKARALAELGYLSAAVDVYGVGKRGTDQESSAALMTGLLDKPDLLRRRLTAAYQAVRTLDNVDPDRIAVIGHCFGGLCALLMGRMGLPLKGVASFHGLLKVGEPLEARPKARFLILHGQDDPLVPPEDIAGWAEEMKRIDGDWQMHSYPKVLHAFCDPDADQPELGILYDADAATRAWASMKAFLAEVLA